MAWTKAMALAAAIALAAFSAGCGRDDTGAPDTPDNEEVSVQQGNPTVVMETSKGTIRIELWRDKAPKTVENFLQYVDEGFFDGTIFHRVIPGFMIQGGGFTPELDRKRTRSPITNEAAAELKNERGTLAMARTSEVNSATAQFFINHADNGFLDHGVRDFGYAVF